MPQAITVTDAQGRWAVYVPLRVNGKIVVPDDRAHYGRSHTLSLSCGSATTRMGWSLSFLTTSSAPGSITPGTVTCTVASREWARITAL
jgi:hypothetical protein